jgi:hypothetical protein
LDYDLLAGPDAGTGVKTTMIILYFSNDKTQALMPAYSPLVPMRRHKLPRAYACLQWL